MNFRPRLVSSAWLTVMLVACGFLAWLNYVRIQRVEYATGIAQEMQKVDAASPTGYAGGVRVLIVPEHNNDTYQWIMQTQQMFAREEWRVRHIDYENAPFGHEVNTASPYRWWLGTVAWLDHVISARPIGQSVEHAAFFADPLLHLLLLVGTTIFVGMRFGALPAALLSLGLTVLFPLAGGFLPGAPDQQGLTLVSTLWSVLLLLAGIRAMSPGLAPLRAEPSIPAPINSTRNAGPWFFAAGLVGGVGMWMSVASQVPIVLGIALGALVAAWVSRSKTKDKPGETPASPPWRAWALGGAVASLGAYLIEYFPAHMGSWQLRVGHPLYGLAWFGLGELLVLAVAWIQQGRPRWNLRLICLVVVAVAAVAALPVTMKLTASDGFLAIDHSSLRLTRLPDGVVAFSFLAWLIRSGLTLTVWTTVLPLLLVVPAGWLLFRNVTACGPRAMIAIALGPVLVALGFACRQLIWWNGLDALLLLLLLAATMALTDTGPSVRARLGWVGFVLLLFVPGLKQILPSRGAAAQALTQLEVQGLIERDLVYWLARHAGKAVVLATPNQTTTLAYYGGLRGLGTLNWENRDGFGAAVRIASATTVEEAFELMNRREVTHIVIPSWDPQLDEYARLGLGQVEGSFIERLHRWALPPWLRPVAYQLPTVSGLEGQSVLILEVVEDQDDALSLSRIAEYFVEMGKLNEAAAVGQALRRFPADLGALVARAQVEIAREDTASFTKTVELMRPRLSGAGQRSLLWDRRASLAVVLARAKQMDLARVQVQRCLEEVDEAKLRSLSTGQLYRLLVLGKAFGLVIADQRLRETALDLVPVDLRSRL